MKLLDKVKNLFTEEIDDEVPIRKEVKRVEIAQPRMEPTRPEPMRTREEMDMKQEEMPPISESSALKREENFKFPVYFDDADFADLPKQPKKEEKVKEKEKEKEEEPPVVKIEKAYQGSSPVKVETKKRFRVSPVISPVYGVLDKNYNKDDIKIKSEKTTRRIVTEEKLTVDDIRNKAFGTLEDDLENSILTHTIAKEEPKKVEPSIDIFGEIENIDTTSSNRDLLMHDITFDKKEEKEESQINTSLEEELEKQKQKIEQLNNYINTIQNENEIFPKEEVEKPKEELPAEPIFNEVKEEVPTVVEEVKKVEEIQTVEETTEEKPIDEGDLFSLIDSMYEKRDE